jgi:hypothetical protein
MAIIIPKERKHSKIKSAAYPVWLRNFEDGTRTFKGVNLLNIRKIFLNHQNVSSRPEKSPGRVSVFAEMSRVYVFITYWDFKRTSKSDPLTNRRQMNPISYVYLPFRQLPITILGILIRHFLKPKVNYLSILYVLLVFFIVFYFSLICKRCWYKKTLVVLLFKWYTNINSS